jgi:hypothetical protein
VEVGALSREACGGDSDSGDSGRGTPRLANDGKLSLTLSNYLSLLISLDIIEQGTSVSGLMTIVDTREGGCTSNLVYMSRENSNALR